MKTVTTPVDGGTHPARMMSVRVQHVRTLAEGIIELDLRAAHGAALPAFTAGSHIDVEVPLPDEAGRHMVRQYSLSGDPADHSRYVIGVARDPQSRGGSRYLHDHLASGDTLRISEPRNHFALDERAQRSVLIAGGIGVTPLVAMARRLSAIGKPWELYLCARTPQRAAYLDELQALPGGRVTAVFDGIADGKPIDLRAVFDSVQGDDGTHFYCCGPSSLMEAFETQARDLPSGRVHVEWFKPKPVAQPVGGDPTFQIKLAKRGIELSVPPEQSMLDVLLAAGVEVPHSCCDGVCGTCQTAVLEGVPDHRDSVLFGADAEANDRVIVCVSRAKTATITLDL